MECTWRLPLTSQASRLLVNAQGPLTDSLTQGATPQHQGYGKNQGSPWGPCLSLPCAHLSCSPTPSPGDLPQ